MGNKRVIGILIVGVDYAYQADIENSFQTEILLAQPRLMTREQASASLQNFAQEVFALSVKELKELAKILRDEYGICPSMNEVLHSIHEEDYYLIFQQTEKENNYVPKKLGCINSRPKGGFKRRRNLFF